MGHAQDMVLNCAGSFVSTRLYGLVLPRVRTTLWLTTCTQTADALRFPQTCVPLYLCYDRWHREADACSCRVCVVLCSVDSVEEEVAAELKQLMDEVWVLGSLSHPSITRFCALCLDPPTIVMQVRCPVFTAGVCVWASCDVRQVAKPPGRQATVYLLGPIPR